MSASEKDLKNEHPNQRFGTSYFVGALVRWTHWSNSHKESNVIQAIKKILPELGWTIHATYSLSK